MIPPGASNLWRASSNDEIAWSWSGNTPLISETMTFTRSGNSVLRESLWKNSIRSSKPFAAAIAGQIEYCHPTRSRKHAELPLGRPTARTLRGRNRFPRRCHLDAPQRQSLWRMHRSVRQSAIIAPKSRREYISTDGNTSGGGVHQRQIGAPRPRQSTHKARRYVRGRECGAIRRTGTCVTSLPSASKLCGALFPIQKPVHVGILDKTEKRLTRTHCFYPRRIDLFNARSEEVQPRLQLDVAPRILHFCHLAAENTSPN